MIDLSLNADCHYMQFWLPNYIIVFQLNLLNILFLILLNRREVLLIFRFFGMKQKLDWKLPMSLCHLKQLFQEVHSHWPEVN